MRISVILPVLTPTPFLRAMTEFTIKTLRQHADDKAFELVVVEAEGTYFQQYHRSWQALDDMAIQKYLTFTPRQGSTRDFNSGARAATGDFIVSTGNDVIVPPGWDTQLLRCFEERADCGVASLSALEPGAIVGPPYAMDMIVEGMYSPFMMWRRGGLPGDGWLLDEAYRKIYCDSDIIMRFYEAGKRAYRSCRAHVHHLVRMTSDRVDPQRHNADLAHDERLFYQRWGKSPLAMFGMIRSGQYTYGREHEAWLRQINLHYDPNKAEG